MLFGLFLVLALVAGAFLLNWLTHQRRQAKIIRFKLMKMREKLYKETPPDNPPPVPPGGGNKRKEP